jgi:molybdopterin molybdotransferase
VAVFFTGDELTEPGQPLVGHIYNSNRYWLVPELMRLGCDVTDLGIVPDSLSRTVKSCKMPPRWLMSS